MTPTDPPVYEWGIFHPLDHYPWDPDCKAFYGGWRTHMQYWWEYRFDSWLDTHVRIVLCGVGVHDWTEMHYPPKGGWPRLPSGFPDFKSVPPTIQCRRCWRKKHEG